MVFIASLLIGMGCKTTHAPDGYLKDPDQMDRNPNGGWADVYLHEIEKIDIPADSLPDAIRNDNKQEFKLENPYSGELIAVEPDTLFLNSEQQLIALPKSTVEEVDLQGYHSGYSTYVGSTILGVLSTISHGLFLVISAPLWILFGTGFASAQSRIPILEYPNKVTWNELHTYARFPQGIPEKLTSADLDSLLSSRTDRTAKSSR